MTESTAPAMDAASQPAPSGRRGRPRTEATIIRDNGVLKLLASGPRSAAQLAAELNLPKPGIAYLAIYRLRHGANADAPLVQRTASQRNVYELTEAGVKAAASLP